MLFRGARTQQLSGLALESTPITAGDVDEADALPFRERFVYAVSMPL